MTSDEKLLSNIEQFLSKNEMSATQFGLAAMNDGKFVFFLREGRSPSLKTMDRVKAFMSGFVKTEGKAA